MKSKEDKQYKDHEKKLKNINESKRNMRVDMRPKVVAKIMTKELVLGLFAIISAVAMPLYYLKIKRIKEEWQLEKEQKLWDKQEEKYIHP